MTGSPAATVDVDGAVAWRGLTATGERHPVATRATDSSTTMTDGATRFTGMPLSHRETLWNFERAPPTLGGSENELIT
jgi:hypothetical protein